MKEARKREEEKVGGKTHDKEPKREELRNGEAETREGATNLTTQR